MKDLRIDMIKHYIGTIWRGYEWNERTKNRNIYTLQKLLYIHTDMHPPIHTQIQVLSKQKWSNLQRIAKNDHCLSRTAFLNLLLPDVLVLHFPEFPSN